MTNTIIKNQENSLNQHPSIEKTSNERNGFSCLPSTKISNSSDTSISNSLYLSQQSGQEGRKVAENQQNIQKLNKQNSQKIHYIEARKTKKKSQNQKIQMPKTDSIQVQNGLQNQKKEASMSCSSNLLHNGTKLSKRKNGKQKKKGKKDDLNNEEQFEANIAKIIQKLKENQQYQEEEPIIDRSLQSIEQSDRDFQSNSHSENQSSQLQSTEKFQDVRKPLDRKSSDCSYMSTSSEISLRGNDYSQPIRFKKKDRSSNTTENQRIMFPPFPNQALEFQINKFYRQVQEIKQISFGAAQKNSYPYYTHENKAFPQKERYRPSSNNGYYFKTVNGVKILCINCGFNKQSGDRKIKNKFYQKDPSKRADQLVMIIIQAMRDGVDFILLQEACTGIIRSRLVKALKKWNETGLQETYYYPQSLEKQIDIRTTLILSRHKGQFGSLGFLIEEFPNQYTNYFPQQAYFKFEIEINGRKESVCILCCHLRSNAPNKKSWFTPTQVRLQQLQCIKDFGQRFHQFFCIGDTNVPSSKNYGKDNSDVDRLFVDGIYLGAKDRGTFLYRVSPQNILDERLDRVLAGKQNQRKTAVRINYRDDILLDCCRSLDLTQKQMFRAYPREIIDIRATDHALMGICISFKA